MTNALYGAITMDKEWSHIYAAGTVAKSIAITLVSLVLSPISLPINSPTVCLLRSIAFFKNCRKSIGALLKLRQYAFAGPTRRSDRDQELCRFRARVGLATALRYHYRKI